MCIRDRKKPSRQRISPFRLCEVNKDGKLEQVQGLPLENLLSKALRLIASKLKITLTDAINNKTAMNIKADEELDSQLGA